MRHSLLVLVVAVAIAGPLGRNRPAHAQPVVAGVLLPRLSPSLEPIRADIERSVASGAALAGATVKGPDRVREATAGHGELVSCVTVPCALEMARLLDAGIVVSSEIENAKRSFTVRVTVVQATDGHELGRETATCKSTEPCAPIADTTRDVSREAVRKALEQVRFDQQVAASNQHRAEPAAVAGGAARTGAVAGASATAGPSDDSSESSATAGAGETTKEPETKRKPAAGGSSGSSSAWPWVAFVAGGLSIAAGVYVVTKIDGSQKNCDDALKNGRRFCHDTRDAAIEGWSLIGLGAIAAGAGLYLYFGRDRDGGGSPALTLGPQGVQLRGTF